MTEAECLEFCKAHGFDWGGLYETRSRVSCFCCPLSKISELYAMKQSHPDIWRRMEKMDSTLLPPKDGKKRYFKDGMGVRKYGQWLEWRYSMLGMLEDNPVPISGCRNCVA